MPTEAAFKSPLEKMLVVWVWQWVLPHFWCKRADCYDGATSAAKSIKARELLPPSQGLRAHWVAVSSDACWSRPLEAFLQPVLGAVRGQPHGIGLAALAAASLFQRYFNNAETGFRKRIQELSMKRQPPADRSYALRFLFIIFS